MLIQITLTRLTTSINEYLTKLIILVIYQLYSFLIELKIIVTKKEICLRILIDLPIKSRMLLKTET